MSSKITGASSLAKKLKTQGDLMGREVVSVLKQEARALAIAYGMETTPPASGGDRAVAGFAARIEKEVGRVFVSRDNPSAVYRLMEKASPELAQAYWAAYKSKDPKQLRRMPGMVRAAGLKEGGASASGLRPYRTGKGARVGSVDVGESLVKGNEQKKLVKEQQGKIGVGKAGWYQAALSLGGRVRRNLVSATGKRSTEEVFPAYVRKVSKKFHGLGGAFVGTDRVAIWTNVTYAEAALPSAKRRSAEATARENIAKAMQAAVTALNKKSFKSA